MAKDAATLAHQEWLGYVQPVGLVVSIPAMLAAQAQVNRNIGPDHQRFLSCLPRDKSGEIVPEIRDFPEFAETVLGWEPDDLLGRPGGDALPTDLEVVLPEYNETLRPTYAVREFEPADGKPPWLMLVEELPDGADLDQPTARDDRGWHATPQARFERLLRETEVPIGLLYSGTHLRLIYAPRGETSGYATFAVHEMAQVAGRPIFAALHMLLCGERLFSLPENQRLPAILADSRKYQNVVSTKLAEQVLAALYELLRGFQAADDQRHGELLRDVLADDPDHVYAGLLTVLMRLVFLLYAEDRDLLSSDPVYANFYSVTGLFERLRADAGHYPDTMDQRYGAWAQLLTLFRLIYDGGSHAGFHIPPRRGYLFDPDRYNFLEGRHWKTARRHAEGRLDVPRVSDGVIYRVLHNLLILDGERLSYRTLDVEQIGSVYEAVMGFNLEVAQGRSIAIKPTKSHGAPATVNLEELLAAKPADRAKWLRDQSEQKITGQALTTLKQAKSLEDLLAALEKKIARKVTPNPVASGSMVSQPSDERRRSGSHYRPRSLTEPIVRTTLEPILKALVDPEADLPTLYEPSSDDKHGYTQGEIENRVRLSQKVIEYAKQAREIGTPHPAQILDLKICDPAMGSGAFLVETCRQLGDELIKAWYAHNLLPGDIPPDEDELLYARRLIAQRCVYGVDKNAMAVDLAKLSLWLATLAKDHPFTFLDHALRHGDSLVGLNPQQIAAFHWEPKKRKAGDWGVTFRSNIAARIHWATEARAKILNAREDVQYGDQEQRLAVADEALNVVRLTGDACVSAFFCPHTSPQRKQGTVTKKQREDHCEELFANVSDWYASGHDINKRAPIAAAAARLRSREHPIPPFHWEIEFPEVFSRENGGFDAFVGNPPFLGGRRIKRSLGTGTFDWLQETNERSSGNADLVAFFFRRAFSSLRHDGCSGLIATNTIAQGDTRETGLAYIRKVVGGQIYEVIRRLRWPGQAAVVVSVVHIAKTDRPLPAVLDGRAVDAITSFFFHIGGDEMPVRLASNIGKSFQGVIVLGMGFTFDDGDSTGLASPISRMNDLIAKDACNRERIFPFIGGEETNTHPQQACNRYVINFSDFPLRREPMDVTWAKCDEATRAALLRNGIVPTDYPRPVARDWPDLLSIVEDRVKPERTRKKANGQYVLREPLPSRWWQYADKRPELYRVIESKDRVLVNPLYGSHLSFVFLPARTVFANKLNVLSLDSMQDFAVLQSRVHEVWARHFSSTLKDDLAYTPSDCFDTFAFPLDDESRLTAC